MAQLLNGRFRSIKSDRLGSHPKAAIPAMASPEVDETLEVGSHQFAFHIRLPKWNHSPFHRQTEKHDIGNAAQQLNLQLSKCLYAGAWQVHRNMIPQEAHSCFTGRYPRSKSRSSSGIPFLDRCFFASSSCAAASVREGTSCNVRECLSTLVADVRGVATQKRRP